MIYLFVIVLLLIAYIAYLQYSFAKERKRYVELIAAKDFPEFKMFEKEIFCKDYGVPLWKIKEVKTNSRKDIYCEMIKL